ncbi:MAG TPA: hypothetical protein VNL98_06100 [Gemmatimonadales bacterium]|nr:hypothetical protein [Gemmatimonadales bacterium]
MRLSRRLRRVIGIALGCLCAVAAAIWLAGARAADYGELLAANVAALESDDERVVVERIELVAANRRLACMLRRPAGPAGRPGSQPRPVLVVAGGFRTGGRAPTLIDPAWPGLMMACDYPWDDYSRLSAPRFIWRLPAIRSEVVATPEVLRLTADYLLTRPDVEPRCLAAVGASLGVFPVAAWAARDSRPRAVALLYGGAPLSEVFAANLRRRFENPTTRGAVAAVLARVVAPLDAGRTVGLISPRPVLIVGARGDERIPALLTDTLFARAREPRRLVWMDGVHLRADADTLLRRLGDTVAAWLGEVLSGCGSGGRE